MGFGRYLTSEDLEVLKRLHHDGFFIRHETNMFDDHRFILSEADNFDCRYVGEETPSAEPSYYFYWELSLHANLIPMIATFEEVLNNAPEEIQIKILYHLDFFRKLS